MKLTRNLSDPRLRSITYASLRISIGVLLMINGWQKWLALPTYSVDFPDPLGMGSITSFYLVLLAEFFGGLGITLGLLTRLASIPVVITFFVAIFIVHSKDSFDEKQAAILYLIASSYILIIGAGRFSLENLIATICNKVNGKTSAEN